MVCVKIKALNIFNMWGVKKVGDNMGMTDKQFNSYVRLILTSLKEILKLLKDGDKENANAKLQELTDNLQQTIED